MSGSTRRPRKVDMEGKNGSNRRLTSEDVARVAGVSISAVSRAFTPGASVAPSSRGELTSSD